ncbi:hypothetical protein EJV47_07085 [Hymenobacter gummosus]|uniref:Uncharacterized protein n=1 Tax=Hymenobacter gummosus TaxID=1776032 RepID=A0A3S0JFP9_9BACT|nr:hypothetical protein [Hymenobacter gummosus]RTQ51556.1 hypothetical protein EJV47_07085 [Hymenobacter gummosus]
MPRLFLAATLPAALVLLLPGCNSSADNPARTAALATAADTPAAAPPAAPVAATAVPNEMSPNEAADSLADETEIRYVVIADTSRQYRPLLRQMLRLQAATAQRIDSMGRFYDAKKNLIRLPDEAPPGDKSFDDLYAGDYYPRRLGDSTLSVEYTVLYTPAHPKSMALVAGIFEQPGPADSLLAVVRRTAPRAFRVKSSLYMGCLH